MFTELGMLKNCHRESRNWRVEKLLEWENSFEVLYKNPFVKIACGSDV